MAGGGCTCGCEVHNPECDAWITTGYKATLRAGVSHWDRRTVFAVGQTHNIDTEVEIGLAKRGLHFCTDLAHTLLFYPFAEDGSVEWYEVRNVGSRLIVGADKNVCDGLYIVRKLTLSEVKSSYGFAFMVSVLAVIFFRRHDLVATAAPLRI